MDIVKAINRHALPTANSLEMFRVFVVLDVIVYIDFVEVPFAATANVAHLLMLFQIV